MDTKEDEESRVTRATELQLHDSVSARTGTLWTAVAHIITGVIGAGVLSLAWAMAELGWIAGPVAVVAFLESQFSLLFFSLIATVFPIQITVPSA